MRLPVLYVLALGLLFCQRPALSQTGHRGTRRAGGSSTKTLIASDKTAPSGRFSYMCSLRTERHHEHFCGAMLVRPDWILTAAHCIDRGEENSPLRPIVYCGIEWLNQTDPDLIFDAGPSYIHESWDGNELLGFDIALLKLDRNSSLDAGVLPELDAGDNTLEPGEYLTALGWGATETSPNSNELRMAGTLEFVPSGTCNRDYWDGDIKEDRMICAGLKKERVCKGDSGGPLIRPDTPQGKLGLGRTSGDVVLGITSFNYKPEKCGERERPAVFTSVAYFVDWISEKIGEDVTEGRGPVRSSGSQTKRGSGTKKLSNLLPRELVAEMKRALKKDDEARAKRILEYLHVNETLEATIPGAGRSDLPLLHAAAMFDASKCAQVLIDAGAGVESRVDDYYEMAPLHVCGIFGSLKVAKVLLKRKNGGSVNSRDAVGDAAMHKAATHGRVELIEFLIEKTEDADLFPVNYDSASPLHEAARAGQVNATQLLLEKGANGDYPNENEWTPLHHASYNNHTGVVEALLDGGVNVDAEDEIGETPLHKACYQGNTEIVRLLLLNRANSYLRENRGNTAMHNAIWGGDIESVKLLLRSGVSANTASYKGYTALHSASFHGQVAIAELLIKKEASVEAEDEDGNTPLSQAVYNGHLEMVELLIKEGARVDTYRSSEQETLLHVASRFGNVGIVKVLLRNGANVHARMDNRNTPLHKAAENGHRRTVEVLLDAGASKTAIGSSSRTPAGRACVVSGSCGPSTRSALSFMLKP